MRKSRYLESGLFTALAIVFCTTLLPTVAAADRDHGKKKHRDRDRKEVVVRVDGRAYPRRDHERVRYERVRPERVRYYEVVRTRPERYCPPPPRHTRYYYPVRRWAAPPPLPRYSRYYFDPYCGENFVSLTLYFDHLRHHRHASFAWAMRIGSEEPLYACHHVHDRWERWDDDDYYDD